MSISLRVATAQDAALIGRLHALSWRSAYTNVLSADYLAGPVMEERARVWAERYAAADPSLHVILAEEAGEALGFVGIYGGQDPERGTLVDNLHVLPSAKGRGVGALLLRAAARWALAHYPQHGLYLTVWEANTPARGFYRRMGGVEGASEPHERADGGGHAPALPVFWRDVAALAAE